MKQTYTNTPTYKHTHIFILRRKILFNSRKQEEKNLY